MTLRDARQAGLPPKRRKLRAGMLAGSVCVLAACLAIRYYWGAGPASADPPRRSPVRAVSTAAASARGPRQAGSTASTPATGTSQMRVVATVNHEEITRTDLARECLTHYGEKVLERVVNKYLIMQECQRRGISVTQAEVKAEIERIAGTCSVPVDQLLKVLEEERGITAEQYSNDVIWVMQALRKLAGDRLEVSQDELVEQYEAQYGPAVKARLIVCGDRRTAESVRAEAAANPDRFGELAKSNSVDVSSASVDGIIQPIRKHVGHKEIEEVAFRMKKGEISPVIQVGDQYAILKCEGQLPSQRVTFEQAKMGMIETIHNSKTHQLTNEILRQLQKGADVKNVLNTPELRRQMPGVAALINGQKITDRELAELCIARHGETVLEGTINRRLLEQACKRQNVTVTDEEVDEEIRRVASLYLRPKEDGSPDVERWLEMVPEEQGVSVDVYRSDAVWPSVTLKKLVGDQVEVTDEDLQRGYEANYGPRVRCLAIVLNNLRKAQEVWAMARDNPTPEFFGDLAEQYSVDGGSRALRGQVPPIQKHGGQPVLEKAAFALEKGELSSIVQVGRDRYVILLCEGRTEPVRVEFAEVRDEVYADIFEKKQKLAMGEYFQKLQESATIDNYLAGTSQSPRRVQTAGRPSTRR